MSDTETAILNELMSLNHRVGELTGQVVNSGAAVTKLFQKVDDLAIHGCAMGGERDKRMVAIEDEVKALKVSDNRSHGKAAVLGGGTAAGILAVVGGIVKAFLVWNAQSPEL